jgi:uncharacterized sporulation protein YeaH/YhbH (DUF444 family)
MTLKLTRKDGTPISAATIIDDERTNDTKTTGSSKQFKDLYKGQIKRAVRKAINDGNISDIIHRDGIDVVGDMPTEDVSEPIFHSDQGGISDRVHPGNDQFQKGDLIERPQGGGGSGGSGDGDASDSGEGEDDFVFHIGRDEYLDLLFKDLELPNQAELNITNIEEWKLKRDGFSDDGTSERLDIARTKQKNLSRRIAFGDKNMKLVADLGQKTQNMLNEKISCPAPNNFSALKSAAEIVLGAVDLKWSRMVSATLVKKREKSYFILCESIVDLCRITIESKKLSKAAAEKANKALDVSLEKLYALIKSKKRQLAIDESIDGRFKNFSKKPVPSTQAVMFCLMDVSGSMDQHTKDLAKRYYIMLYLFLSRTYKNIEVVYIRHHTSAKEVDEQEFFYGQETGGTVVSSALNLMNEIQEKRYPASEWNIYVAQASDGDNWGDDSTTCKELVAAMLNNYCRYYVYVEITERQHQSLWREYEKLAAENNRIFLGHIRSAKDIYPVFRDGFQKANA